MNWLTTLAVLLLTFQNDVVLSTSTKSLWLDPDKASSTMDCLITKIGESENFPQDVKEDLESIMNTMMSGISGANAKGKNSGPRIQAINMAIASSLAEIVVSADEENPKDIAAKTQDLVGGLEQCFESVMGTIDKKFIGEINDLISMFAKEAASEIEEVKDQEDPSSSSSTETASKSTVELSLSKAGDQVPESKPIEDGTEDPKTAPSEVDLLSSRPEPNGVEPKDSQTTPEIITGTTNELVNASTSTIGLKKDVPQQIIQTAVQTDILPSSSYHSTSQSSANNHQSSHIIQGSSETARGVLIKNRKPEYFVPLAAASESEASKSTQKDIGPQVLLEARGFISSETKKPVDAPTWRVFLGNEVPQKTVSIFGNSDRLHSLSTDTTSQFTGILKPISTYQESSQFERGHKGTYSGPQLPKPSLIDIELGTSQASSGILSKTVNKQENTSTLKVVNEMEDISTGEVVNEQEDTSPRIGVVLGSVVPQQTKLTVNPKGPLSSTKETRQSADNTYQSNQTFKDRRYGIRKRRPDFFKPSSIAAGSQVSTQNDVGTEIAQPTFGHIGAVGNELADTSTRIGSTRNRIPQHTGYESRFSSSSYETTRQSATNNYQSSQTYQGSSQTSDGYGRRNHRHKFPDHRAIAAGLQSPNFDTNNVGFQALPEKPGYIPREANKLEDTSTRRVFMRNGVPQRILPTEGFLNTPSSSFSRASQFSDNSNESSQITQGLSQRARGNGGIIHRPDIFESPLIASGPKVSKPTQNNFEHQISQPVPGVITGVADELVDTTTRITGLRNSVPQQTAYSNKSSYQGSQSDVKSYQSSQAFQGSIQATDAYRRRYHKPQLIETTTIDVESKALRAAPGLVSRVVNGQGDTSTRRVVNDQGDTSTQRVVNDQGDRSTLTVVNDQGDTSTLRVANEQGDISTQIVVNDQGDTSTVRVANEQGDISTQGAVSDQGDTSTLRVANDQVDASTQIGAVLRDGETYQTTSTAQYPKRPSSSLFKTSQSASNTYHPSQIFQGSSQTIGGNPYSRSQMSQPERIGDEPQIPQTALGLALSSVSQDAPKRPFSSSFQTSHSAGNTYQHSQILQGSSQIIGGYPYSGSELSQSERIGDGAQILQATSRLTSLAGNQDAFNERPNNQQWHELSVIPTLNSPIGLRSSSASARISQMISAVLNTVGPNGIDVNALARSLKDSVLNIKSSGMSPSDAKLEVLLELVVGLLQIVRSAQVQEINTDASEAVTNSAARCFELGLA